MTPHDLDEILKRIRIVFLDFDGTLTDGHVWTTQGGEESVCCSRLDSLGCVMLMQQDVRVCVISKETNPVVSARCKKMGIECQQSVSTGEGKAEIMQRLAKEAGVPLGEVAFMGDDVNDLPAMRAAGLAISPTNGHRLVKEIAHLVTKESGGNGAVRELCELILTAKGFPIAI